MSRILVIDDEPNIRNTVSDILQLNGYAVSTAASGAQGIQMAMDELPNLIICDVMMPQVSGYEVATSIRKSRHLQAVPFLFLSAKSTLRDVREGMNTGASDYITKPFNIHELLAAVKLRLQMAKDTNEKHYALEQNLKSAMTIQRVILPEVSDMAACFSDFFCLWKPRDLISGDFYWFQRHGNRSYLAVADCTGHGVRAGMLSMVCFEKLNSALREESTLSPGQVLTKVNAMVVEFMRSGHETADLQDGMDIALCCIDHTAKTLTFSGAQRPLVLIGSPDRIIVGDQERIRPEFMHQEKVYYRVKGDLHSIGGANSEDAFTQFTIPIEKGDRFYMFSDGYQDQLGGANDRRFKSSSLRQLLFSHRNDALAQQKKALEETLNTWIGDGSQTDDILVIGFEL